jgi:hypothetical protein
MYTVMGWIPNEFVHMDLFLTRRDSPIANDCRPINSDSQACSNNYFVLFLFLPVAKCRPQVLAFSYAVQFSSHTWSCRADTWQTRFFHLFTSHCLCPVSKYCDSTEHIPFWVDVSQIVKTFPIFSAIWMSIAVSTIFGQRAVFCKRFH